MLDLYWAPKPAPFSVRGLIGELAAAVGFCVAAVACLLVIQTPSPGSAIDVALLLAAYVAATQVRFEIGSSFVVPTQLTLVPLLFIAPLGAVPLLVGAAMLVGAGGWVARGLAPPDRLVSAVADGWHVIGPVIVLAVAGAGPPSLADWPIYLTAFASQVVVEGIVLSLREWVDRGIPVFRHAMALGEGHIVDGLLFPAGLMAAGAAHGSGHAGWALLTVPVVGLFGLVDRERRQRIRISQERLALLEAERTRGEAALARVGQAMESRLDRGALLELAARSAVEAISADGAVVRTRGAQLMRVGRPPAAAETFGLRVLAENAADAGLVDGHGVIAAPIVGLPERAVLLCTRPGEAFSTEERARLLTLVAQLGAALQTAATHELMRHQAETDHLTGLINHRRFQELLVVTIDQARRTGAQPALVLLDLDNFKRINDTHGHQVGDTVLQAVGRLLRRECRQGDEPARYGGEELAVLIDQATDDDAIGFAEGLRAAIEGLVVTTPDGTRVPVTASVGVAVASGPLLHAPALVAAADAGLYAAKRAGRNRVILGKSQTPGPPE